MLDALRDQVEGTWERHPHVENGNVTIIRASAGQWVPRSACRGPRVWLFLVGHYRTFSWTRDLLASTMNFSSANCYFVCALVPQQIEPRSVQNKHWSVRPHVWKNLSTNFDGAAELMTESAKAFRGQLAFAVVHRTGKYDQMPVAHIVSWHGVWAVARWAAHTHGFSIDPAAVVVRTRPDVLLRTPFAIGWLQHYFRETPRGRHLMIGQDVRAWAFRLGSHWTAQSDYFAVTSFVAFETDIALPIELTGRAEARRLLPWGSAEILLRAYQNGWGNHPSAGSPDEVCMCLPYPRRAMAAPLLQNDKSCPKGRFSSCRMTTVESLIVPAVGIFESSTPTAGAILRDPPPASSWPPPMLLASEWEYSYRDGKLRAKKRADTKLELFELTEHVRCRCAVRNRDAAINASAITSSVRLLTDRPLAKLGERPFAWGPRHPLYHEVEAIEDRSRDETFFLKCKNGALLRPASDSAGHAMEGVETTTGRLARLAVRVWPAGCSLPVYPLR